VGVKKDFKLPDLGEGVHEGQIVKLFVREGESVREDAPLMEVETDKASVEIPSPFTGVVAKVHVREGQLVRVGDVMVSFGESGVSDSAPGSATSVAESTKVPATTTHPPTPSLGGRGSESAGAPMSAASTSSRTSSITQQHVATKHAASHRRKPASPAVRKLARSFGLDIEMINGSGPGGRITISDIEHASQSQGAGSATSVAEFHSAHTAFAHAPHTPTSSLRGSGSENDSLRSPSPSGREHTALARIHAPAMKSPARATIEGAAGSDSWGPIVRSPISRVRKTIADTMTHSVRTIPHVTDTGDADITELDKLRRGYAGGDAQRKLTILPFVVRAVALALAKHPIFNASYDDAAGEIVYHEYISIAVGVQTERGLVAPVLREADRLSIAAIADELNVLAENARSARFQVNDTRGGTFTISNAGAMGGSRYSTPIVNHPQVAVLAVGRSMWMPWVVEPPTIEARLVMPLSLSFDHRIIDGGASIPFLQDIIGLLQHPARLVL